MSDYISREEAIMAVTRAKLPDTTPEGVPIANGKRSVTDCVRRIKDIPAADVRPVLRGRWVFDENDILHCSVCDCENIAMMYEVESKLELVPKYCPNCGAKMEAEGEIDGKGK